MKPQIVIEKVWEDNDVVEYQVTTSDGCSQYCVRVYVAHQDFESIIADLDRFKTHIHGGTYDILFGKFGLEYAKGAFAARLHFYPPGRGELCITVNAESEWFAFGRTEVASRATLYLKSEPGLLDNFIRELKKLKSGIAETATLECVS